MIREKIIKKYGSIAVFSRAAGLEYRTSLQMLKEAETDKAAEERLYWLFADTATVCYTRHELRAFFAHKMQGNYKTLLAEVQKTIPHLGVKRLRHYLSIHQACRRDCPTYIAICQALQVWK